jgi:hypothetical protein
MPISTGMRNAGTGMTILRSVHGQRASRFHGSSAAHGKTALCEFFRLSRNSQRQSVIYACEGQPSREERQCRRPNSLWSWSSSDWWRCSSALAGRSIRADNVGLYPPICEVCDQPMSLRRVWPRTWILAEVRIFECLTCGNTCSVEHEMMPPPSDPPKPSFRALEPNRRRAR